MIEIDLLVKNIKELVNPSSDHFTRGKELNSIRRSENVWIGATGELVTYIGFENDFNKNCRLKDNAVVIDASKYVVIPGLVDPHTHLPFAGTRQHEFRRKLQGESYLEIAKDGGGIKETVRRTRKAELNELIKECEWRLDRMLLSGTTTTEAKSGYGLNMESELKQLEALKVLDSFHPIEIVSTFMGAHDIPDEFKGRNREFLEYMSDEVLRSVSARKLAEFGDIFCEEGYFSYEETEFYIDKLIDAGLKVKVHSDEFISNGAAELAARKGAISAEHLIKITDSEIDILSASDTSAVLLPGVSFFLKMGEYAPVKKLIEKNAIIALGSDFNPGSSMVSSQLFIFHLGIYQMGLTIEQAFNMVTINAAYAIDRAGSCGSLVPGKKMDLLLLDIPDFSYIAYHLGINPVCSVIKSGEIVVEDGNMTFK